MSTVLERPELKDDVELPFGSEKYLLDARIRCDHSSCEAQSYIRATLMSGKELYFCGHHGHEVKASLKPQCEEWYTEESRLIEDKTKGSEN